MCMKKFPFFGYVFLVAAMTCLIGDPLVFAQEAAYSFTGFFEEDFDSMGLQGVAPGVGLDSCWSVLVNDQDVTENLTVLKSGVWGGVATGYNAAPEDQPSDRHLAVYNSASGENTEIRARFSNDTGADLNELFVLYDMECVFTRYVDNKRSDEFIVYFSSDGHFWDRLENSFHGNLNDSLSPAAATWLTTAQMESGSLVLRSLGGTHRIKDPVEPGQSFWLRWKLKNGGQRKNMQVGIDNLFIELSGGDVVNKHKVKIRSPHAPADPSGEITVDEGLLITNKVTSLLREGSTQYVAKGWTMLGHEPCLGSGSLMTMVVTNDAELNWEFDTQVMLEVDALYTDQILEGSSEEWVPLNEVATVEAVDVTGYTFLEWTGDVPEGQASENPVILTMDRARQVTAIYERIPVATPSGIPFVWLEEHGIPNPASAGVEAENPDGDGMSNWEEWICGTDPSDPTSYFDVVGIEVQEDGHVIFWKGGTEAWQVLERRIGLSSEWVDIYTAAPPTSVVGSYLDTEKFATMQYRVRAYR